MKNKKLYLILIISILLIALLFGKDSIVHFWYKQHNIFVPPSECYRSFITKDDYDNYNKNDFDMHNIEKDFKKNIEKDDTRFYCTDASFFGLSLDKYKALFIEHSCRKICTIDVMTEGKKEHQVSVKISRYAKKYNMMLLSYLLEGGGLSEK